MMKKISKILLISFILFFSVKLSAITLGEYEQKVEEYKKELYKQNAKINSTDASIAATKNKITAINNEVNNLLAEQKNLYKEIESNKKEINNLQEKTRKSIEINQLSNKENLYYEYIFDSKDMASFIYKASVINQIIEYNQLTIKNLEDLNIKQEKRRKEINNINNNLNAKASELDKQEKKLHSDRNFLMEGARSIQADIKSYDDLVNTYKKMGCKSKDVIGVDCARAYEAGAFRRPMKKGYVTGWFGEYYGAGNPFHYGLDLSSDNKREPIYVTANGVVQDVYADYYGGKTVIISHQKGGKYYTSIYIHMSSYGPKMYKGARVTSEDLVGYMGQTGWAYGAHLHFEIVPCRYKVDYACRSWSAKDRFARGLYNSGYRGAKTYVNIPDSKYVYWRNR